MHGRTEAIPRGSLTKDHRCHGAGGGRRFGNSRNTGTATGRSQRAIRALRRWSRSARCPSAPVTITRAPAGASGPRTCQTVSSMLTRPRPSTIGSARTKVRPVSRPARRLRCGIGGVATSGVAGEAAADQRRDHREHDEAEHLQLPRPVDQQRADRRSGSRRCRTTGRRSPAARTSTPSRTRPSTHQDQPPSVSMSRAIM